LDHEIAKEREGAKREGAKREGAKREGAKREGAKREDREDGALHAKPRLMPFSIIILSAL
jgi:hypothetical protein